LTPPVQRRGRRRRAALLDAAAELLAEGGFGAVSHRAVADRAGLPLAATTYYFASRDDLAASALEKIMRDELARLRALLAQTSRAAGPRAMARALVAALVPGDPAERSYQLAMYELYVQAGRGDGRLRELARDWNEGCVEVVAELLAERGHHLDDVDVRLITTLADGLTLELLVEERADTGTAVAVLTRALAALGASGAERGDEQ
jgi:DNA-binding transcriptional regulator YbjK